jgi:hypothetical protein
MSDKTGAKGFYDPDDFPGFLALREQCGHPRRAAPERGQSGPRPRSTSWWPRAQPGGSFNSTPGVSP